MLGIQDKHGSDLIVVSAVEGYAAKRGMPSSKVIGLFSSHGIFHLLRSNYETLHMLDLGESVLFAEDALRSRHAG